jgi:hypothetical protein
MAGKRPESWKKPRCPGENNSQRTPTKKILKK